MCAKYEAAGVRNISFIALQKGFIAPLAQELTFFFLSPNKLSPIAAVAPPF